jgi:hypothetical protein
MTDTPKEKPESTEENFTQMNSSASVGFFNISSIAKGRIEAKRKRRGLGEL